MGWKLSQSPKVGKIYFAPGNGGTQEVGDNIAIKATEIEKLLRFALTNKIGLTLVGPEDTLAMGIVDLFTNNNLLVFGPSELATRLESNKAWAVDFMNKYQIPHPLSYPFDNFQKANSFIKSHKAGDYVIKASGLALGKGVILPKTRSEALETIKRIMINKEFGDAGNQIIIQERIFGPEISLLAFADGNNIVPLASAQDHKQIFDHDKGPNTGGMGAYAPVPSMTPQLIQTIEKTILKPTIEGMKKDKCPFQGIIFVGLMITKDGPKVLEYNARFGDPETQSLMMLMKSDLFPVLMSCIKGKLKKRQVLFRKGSAICVVLASKGYPGQYQKGKIIRGLIPINKNVKIFHAGTTRKMKYTVASGGRVLGVTAYAKDIKGAREVAYLAIGKKGVNFSGMQYRKDIGAKALG